MAVLLPPPVRASLAAGARACSRGLYARGASEEGEDAEMVPKPGPVPLRIVLLEEERDVFEAAARARAAAMVSSLSIKGCGLLFDGGSMPFRKSIKLSCLGGWAGGAGWLEGGRAVNWSSSSSSSSDRSIA